MIRQAVGSRLETSGQKMVFLSKVVVADLDLGSIWELGTETTAIVTLAAVLRAGGVVAPFLLPLLLHSKMLRSLPEAMELVHGTFMTGSQRTFGWLKPSRLYFMGNGL